MSQFTRENLAAILEKECSKNLYGIDVNFIKQPFSGPPASFGLGSWPYCGATVYWGCKQAGLDIPILCPSKFGYSFALVEAWQQWGIEKGFYHVNDGIFVPMPGDIGIIDWSRTSYQEKDTDWDDHVVTFLREENRMYVTAEGNTGTLGQLAICKRSPVIFEGFVRIPDGYEFAPKTSPSVVTSPFDTAFDNSFKALMAIEGGYSNRANDLGGPTNMGITMATLAAYRGRPVTELDVKELTADEAKKLYKANYWDNIQLGNIVPANVAHMIFDQGVNWGPYQAVKNVQQVLNKYFLKGLVEDGDMGPKTLEAINSTDTRKLIVYYVSDQQDKYVSIVKKNISQLENLAGWLNRTQSLLELIW